MWTDKYIKIPFKDSGRTVDGVDCWGLVRLIYKDVFNIDLHDLLGYKDTKDRVTISELYKIEKNDWTPIEFGKEKEYDLIVFNTMGLPTHIALVIGNNMVIHTERGKGTYIVDYTRDLVWCKKRIAGVYRHESRVK